MKYFQSFFYTLKTNRDLRNNLIRNVLISIVFLSMLFYSGLEVKETNFITQTKVQGFILSYGLFSWLAYILLLVIAVMSPVPDTPIVIAGGYIFGPYISIPLTIVGQILGATIDFYLARKLGRNFVNKKFPKASNLLNEYSHKLGWQTVFIMRLTPTLSFDLLSYAAGLSKIKFTHYIVATLSGMIPLIAITSIVGYSASIHSKVLPFITIGIGILFISLVVFIFKKISKNK
jgi:uncharacterized membrane protein YdjX (TVP38/TMEM64 family)